MAELGKDQGATQSWRPEKGIDKALALHATDYASEGFCWLFVICSFHGSGEVPPASVCWVKLQLIVGQFLHPRGSVGLRV